MHGFNPLADARHGQMFQSVLEMWPDLCAKKLATIVAFESKKRKKYAISNVTTLPHVCSLYSIILEGLWNISCDYMIVIVHSYRLVHFYMYLQSIYIHYIYSLQIVVFFFILVLWCIYVYFNLGFYRWNFTFFFHDYYSFLKVWIYTRVSHTFVISFDSAKMHSRGISVLSPLDATWFQWSYHWLNFSFPRLFYGLPQ